jgi:Na+/H+ antiporter NhaC
MKGTDIFTKITVEFVTSILLFHVVVIVLLLRENGNTTATVSAARYNSIYVHGRRKSQNCTSQK